MVCVDPRSPHHPAAQRALHSERHTANTAQQAFVRLIARTEVQNRVLLPRNPAILFYQQRRIA
jgi:hypothetical protein